MLQFCTCVNDLDHKSVFQMHEKVKAFVIVKYVWETKGKKSCDPIFNMNSMNCSPCYFCEFLDYICFFWLDNFNLGYSANVMQLYLLRFLIMFLAFGVILSCSKLESLLLESQKSTFAAYCKYACSLGLTLCFFSEQFESHPESQSLSPLNQSTQMPDRTSP